jgi:ABC-type phosphonate transport system ATPase subunit
VLLDTSTGELHVLNPAAAAVWYELDGEADVEQIAARLSEAAGAEREHVLRDVIGFVDQLARSGLLSASDAALDVGTTALDVGTTTAD